MQISLELKERLEKLRKYLTDEIKKTEAEAKRDYAPARIVNSASGVAIVHTEMEFNYGELVGSFKPHSKPKPIGFVVRKFERFGKKYYVVNTRSIDHEELQDAFQICKVDFLYSLEKRLEAINNEIRDFKVLKSFEIVDPKDSDFRYESRLPLDEFQKTALDSAILLDKGEILLVVGPPGTGKTQFITEAGRILGKIRKTLIVSQIHQAVDNVFERLADIEDRFGDKIDYAIRVGHVSKISEKAKKFSPENKYLDGIPEDLSFDELVERYSSAFKRINKEYTDLLNRQNFLIGATALKTITNPLNRQKFDFVFIDEAHNICLSTALLVLRRTERAVLTGDPWQIPPIYSGRISIAERSKFGVFNILYELAEKEMKEILWLRHNYRSNPKITKFSSEFIYNGKVIPRLNENYELNLKATHKWMDSSEPMVFIHVDGVMVDYSNEDEAKVVAWLIKELKKAGADLDSIVVLTPYKNQVEKIREEIIKRDLRKNEVEIKTVHSYLGAEKDIVIFSVVATSPSSFGFLDSRMINVVTTRAKKKLIVVGNYSKILENPDKPISKLLEYVIRNGLFIAEEV